METFQTKVVVTIKTDILRSIALVENLSVYEITWKMWWSWTGHMTIWRMHNAAAYLRTHTHTHTRNM